MQCFYIITPQSYNAKMPFEKNGNVTSLAKLKLKSVLIIWYQYWCNIKQKHMIIY